MSVIALRVGLILVLASPYCLAANETTLQLLGMFPDLLNPLWPNGYWCIPAARLAVDHVNNASILPQGYRLDLRVAISECSRIPAASAFIKKVVDLEPENLPVAILGPGCSDSTLQAASLNSQGDYNLLQVTYGATSPSLSNLQAFPFLYRTVSTNSALARTMALLVKTFGWSQVATFYENNVILRNTALNFHRWVSQLIPDGNIAFSSVLQDDSSVELAMEQLSNVNVRIIVVFASADTLREVLCQAGRREMIYPRYVWIFPEHYGGIASDKNEVHCSKSDLEKAAFGSLDIYYLTYSSEATTNTLVTGVHWENFNSTYTQRLNEFYAAYIAIAGNTTERPATDYQFYRTTTYDAVVSIAMALNRTEQSLKAHNLSLKDFPTHQRFISEELQKNIKDVQFQGASGFIKFHESHIVFLPVLVTQGRLKEDGNFSFSGVGFQEFTAANPDNDNITVNHDALVWKLDPPSDSFKFEDSPPNIILAAFVLLVAALGFLLNTFSLLVNFIYRDAPSIKATSPGLNVFIFSGNYSILLFIVIYSAIYLNPQYSDTHYGTLCNMLPWTITIGYSLVIGTIAGKCFRIYVIFKQTRKIMSKGRYITFLLKDIGLILALLLIIAVDVILIVVWNAHEPLVKETRIIQEEDSAVELRVVSCQPSGTDFQYLVGVIVLFKVLISTLVTIFACQIRTIKTKEFNDAGPSFTFLLVNAVVFTMVGLVLLALFVSNLSPSFSFAPYAVATFGPLIAVIASIVILFIYKHRGLFEKGEDGRRVFLSTLSTRGVPKPVAAGTQPSLATRSSVISGSPQAPDSVISFSNLEGKEAQLYS